MHPLPLATHNCLPATILSERFSSRIVYATQFGNEIVTRIVLGPGGDFENIFSFTHEEMCRLFSATRRASSTCRMIHPERRRRAPRSHGRFLFGTPAFDNRLELLHVIRDHVERFMSLYYLSDDDLRRYVFYTRLARRAHRHDPERCRGAGGHASDPAGSVELLATLVYMTTVEHEIVDANIFDYQLWNDVQPARVYETGISEPLDVYQRLVTTTSSSA